MRPEFSSLVKKLYAGNISKEEFLERYFDGKVFSEISVLELLTQAISKKDGSLVSEVIVLLYTEYFKISSFLFPLCQLLDKNWHTNHEEIVTLLQQTKSSQIVDCLYNSTELQFDYLAYDDTYQFARKCIKALSAIADENAIKKLKILTSSKISVIANYAKKELNYKKFL